MEWTKITSSNEESDLEYNKKALKNVDEEEENNEDEEEENNEEDNQFQFKILPPSPSGERNSENVIKLVDNTVMIKNFNDLDVSTMTLIACMDGEISLLNMFYMLPVCHISIAGYKNPGTITSCRYLDMVRGEPGGFFKNAIMVNVWTKKKNETLKCKIMKSKIQITGAKEIGMGREVAEYIVDALNESIKLLNTIKKFDTDFNKSIDWLMSHCYDKKSQKFSPDCENPDEILIKWPAYIPLKHRDILKPLRNSFDDLNFISEIANKINFVKDLEIPPGTDTKLYLTDVGKSMVNYTYSLGFSVNRLNLAEILCKFGLQSDFMNTVRTHVSLKMCSKIKDDDDVVRRKGGEYSEQTFLIYLSGNIMHSGQGGIAMEECYYRLIKVIAAVKDIVLTCED